MATKTEWGKIKPLQRKNGLRYWAGEPVGKDQKGNTIYRGSPEGTYTSRAKAKDWLNKRRYEREGQRELSEAAKADSTFGWWLDKWHANHKQAWMDGHLSPNGWSAVDISYRNWITRVVVDGKKLTDYRVRKVDVDLLKKVQVVLRNMRGVRGGLSPSQSHGAELKIYSVLKLAADEGAIPRNPFKETGIYVTKEKFHRELGNFNEDMLDELIEHMPPEYRAAIFLWAYTGLRAGEVWGLQVRDLHLDNKRVEINRQLSVCKEHAIRDDNHKYVSGEAHPVGVCLKCPLDSKGNAPREIPFGTRIRLGLSLRPPKTGRVKTLDLHSFVVDELRKHLELRGAQRPDDWVFVDQRQRRGGGLPVNHVNWYGYHFKPVVRMLEWEDEITVHHLRHFCGSYHLMKGVKPFVVQQMLDHSDAEMTRLYSHIIKGMASDSFEAIEAEYEARKAG